MQGAPYEQMRREAGNWVKRGRARLLRHLLATHAPPRRPLELLDLGAGFGGNVATLATFGSVDVLETNPEGIAALRAEPRVGRLFTEPVPFDTEARWDVVAAIEVLEHLEEDALTTLWLLEHLRPGGVLVATVPAHPRLFNDHDRAVGHHRRYTRESLVALLQGRAELLACGWFLSWAFPGVIASQVAWQLQRRLRGDRRHRKMPSPTGGPLDALLGAALSAEVALVERGVRMPIGHSLYLVARRP